MAVHAAQRMRAASPGATGAPRRGLAQAAGQQERGATRRATLDGVVIEGGLRWWGRLSSRTRRALAGVMLALVAALGVWGVAQAGPPALTGTPTTPSHAKTHVTSHVVTSHTTQTPTPTSTSTPPQPAYALPFAPLGRLCVWLFGVGAYPTLALLLALGLVWLAEGVARRRLLRRWLAPPVVALWLLIELGARLVGGQVAGGAIGDALAAPLTHAPLELTQLLVLLVGLSLALAIGVTLANDLANALVALPGATLGSLIRPQHPRARNAPSSRASRLRTSGHADDFSDEADGPDESDAPDDNDAQDGESHARRRGIGRRLGGEVAREATREVGRGAMDALLAGGAVAATRAIQDHRHHQADHGNQAHQASAASVSAVASQEQRHHPLIEALIGRTARVHSRSDDASVAVAAHANVTTRAQGENVVALAEELARRTQQALLDQRAVTQVYPLEIGAAAIRLCVRPVERFKRDAAGRVVTDEQGAPVVVRTRVSRILALRDELAQALDAPALRLAPLPPEESPTPDQPALVVEIPRR